MNFIDITVESVILRSIMALVIGALLGIEREKKQRPAGLRTHMLVCFGAALVMMTNQYVFQTFNASDPVRMGAQVISGIGFLGAGTIMVIGHNNRVKGVTTAANLWAAACCGLATGVGFYEGAVAAGVLVTFVLIVLQKVDKIMEEKYAKTTYYVELNGENALGNMLRCAKQNNITVRSLNILADNCAKGGNICVIFDSDSKDFETTEEMTAALRESDNVIFIESVL
ncbi:MAG: MgtC/SapB family protein [Clostridiales bacterium]|nr:MgtC/SapB family protein [Clostridiales bacterium]